MLLSVSSVVYGAETKNKPVSNRDQVEYRIPDSEQVEEYLNDDAFLYDRRPPPATTWWDKFWSWFFDLFDRNDSRQSWGWFDYTWEAIKWILIAGAVVFAVYVLFKNDLKGIFYGKSKNVDLGAHEVEENIHEIDFESLITDALAQKDYRRAIRLYYLKTLKWLTDKEMINWQINKTNRDYYHELEDRLTKDKFNELSRVYEYVWYGDMEPDESMGQSAILRFKTFMRGSGSE